MVNFHDPAVIAQDLCEYPFAAKHEGSESLLHPPFDSGGPEALAHPGWSLHVSLPGCVIPLPHNVSNNNNSALHL
jgi:hypothetical protein